MPPSCMLKLREKLTVSMSKSPLSAKLVITRAKTYEALQYLDLAAADAYYALTLAETAIDPAFSDLEPQVVRNGETIAWIESDENDGDCKAAKALKVEAIEILIRCLTGLGCLKVAFDYLLQLDSLTDFGYYTKSLTRAEFESESAFRGRKNQNPWYLLQQIVERYEELKGVKLQNMESIRDVKGIYTDLPTVGLSRREVYRWNSHEPDRISPDALRTLNEKLAKAAPDIEAKGTTLPILTNHTDRRVNGVNQISAETSNGITSLPETSLQLGLFAKKDLPPNSAILRERSIITAVRPIDASLCDACASPLPELSSAKPPVACEDCELTVFCSRECLDLAKAAYHNNAAFPAESDDDAAYRYKFCDNEDGLDEIGRNAQSPSPADDLYFLLITRTIAMAETQGVHPLDLFETKYLCGEFNPTPPLDLFSSDYSPKSSSSSAAAAAAPAAPATLPFTFTHNIVLPFRYFTTLLLSHPLCTPYSAHWLARYDHWVIQTLYAKFRGVASARQSTWDAKPEVAAVHPLWCLANHSCDPNVQWEWGGGKMEREIVYTVRGERVWDRGKRLVGGMEELTVREGEENGKENGQDDNDEDIGKRNGKERERKGIKAGEEILNHYCDVRLPVQERRVYARGPLGGDCRCERCVWESGESLVKAEERKGA